MDNPNVPSSQENQDIISSSMDEVEKRKEAALQRKEEMRQKAQERQALESQQNDLGTQTSAAPLAPRVDQPSQTNSFLPPATAPNTFANPAPPLRDEQIRNAVEFLQDPRIVPSPMDRKRKFLQSKGLTDEEIDEAVNRAGVQQPQTRAMAPQQYQPPQQQQYYPPALQVIPQGPPPSPVIAYSLKTLGFILIACASLGSTIVWFFKKYILPRINGSHKAKKKQHKKSLKQQKKEREEAEAQLDKHHKLVKQTLEAINNYSKRPSGFLPHTTTGYNSPKPDPLSSSRAKKADTAWLYHNKLIEEIKPATTPQHAEGSEYTPSNSVVAGATSS